MSRLVITDKAEADLFELWSQISVDNSPAADRLYRAIMSKLKLAATHPFMGVARPELGPRVRILVEGPYIAIYEPLPDGITVIAVIHGMRDPDGWLA